MEDKKSLSEAFRKKGNDSLQAGRQLKKKGESDKALEKFKESITHFRDSIDEAMNSLESSSAYKNIGIAYMEMCSIKKEEKWLNEARRSILSGIKDGIGHQPEKWLADVCEKFKSLAENYFFDEEKRAIFYTQTYRSKFEWGCFKPMMMLLARELAFFFSNKTVGKSEFLLSYEKKVQTLPSIKEMVSHVNEFQSLLNEASFYIAELESMGSSTFSEDVEEWKKTIYYEKKTIQFLKALYSSRNLFEKKEYWHTIDVIQSFLNNNDITLYEAWGNEIIAECFINLGADTYLDQIRELLNQSVAIFTSNGVAYGSYYYKTARDFAITFQERAKIKEDEKETEEKEKLLQDPVFKKKLEEINQIANEEKPDVFVKKLFELFPNPTEDGKPRPCPSDEDLSNDNIKNTLKMIVIPIYSVNFNSKGCYPLAFYREVNGFLISYQMSLKG